MHQYGVRDVEKLLRLSRSTVRALVEAGFVAPMRGPRNSLRFSFQDLIVLRTAQALEVANVPRRRIMRALRELRSRLPEAMPLSGLSIGAIADHVVVREGGNRWHAESGQYLLAFEGDPAQGALRVIEQVQTLPPSEDGDWYARGVALEREDADAAMQAYERALADVPDHLHARINLGRLLHDAGQLDRAERVYREAIDAGAHDALLFYNLGVLLDDLDRKPDAVRAYEAALKEDPQFADCHYNLALLFEDLGEPRQAIRHMARYRKLVGESGG
ncbi:tetratricopeptide repeat protein [Lysobacter niastensis]|uniref:Tetratricopeptide repeat protein n=1 Tax=Lysobacter niastensis TaxID=380629 RepID=A0ABS0B1T6_9GAMM|nr:tetratricopeptide repeat protein [Lysobacter niastensis]MBF6022453.1 tetratricopeptide repeat protein [Lysobacter niastensis]